MLAAPLPVLAPSGMVVWVASSALYDARSADVSDGFAPPLARVSTSASVSARLQTTIDATRAYMISAEVYLAKMLGEPEKAALASA